MNPKFKPHFRIYYKSGHPAYIVGETKDSFYFHRVTSSPKSGHHSNWKVDPNPDKRRKTPMYIVHQQTKDLKIYFSSKLPFNRKINFIKIKSN